MFMTDQSGAARHSNSAHRSGQARRSSQAIAVSQTNDAVHLGAAVVCSLLVGGGIWVALAHLLKALF
jgi:hypothetical protein